MENIAQNPYRVLGVFPNDPLKTRTANIARIRAFNKVGKSCSFDTDFEEIFGKVERTEDAIIKAERQLSSLEDSEFYGLLWLRRSAHLPLSPSAPADIVSSSIVHDSFDDLINTIIGILYVGNYSKAAELIIKLFNSYDNISESNKRRYLRQITKSFDELSLNDWWNVFKINILNDNIACNAKALLCDFFNALALSELRLLTNFGRFNSENTEWRNIVNARIIANSIIDIVIETCDTEAKEPNSESQIVLSGYVQAMVKACKNYYNSTRFWEAKPVQDIILVLRELYKIAYTSSIKEECAEFGIRLKKEINYLAPNIVRKQALEIRKQIEEFCHKPNETIWSIFLIDNCIQPLTDIRRELGANNLYYKRISSQIANNALYACDNHIDHIDNNPDESLEKIKEVIRQGVQLCVNINELEVDDTFNSSTYRKVIAAINHLCQKYDEKPIQNVKASFSFQSQDDFLLSHQDYNSLITYLENSSDGLFVETAKKKIREIEDKDYPSNVTIETLFDYKKKYPNSHNDDKVLQSLNRLLLGMSIGTVVEYQLFLSLFPNHEKKNVILGRIDLLNFRACKTIADWEKYLKDFPNGQHVAEAKERILLAKQSDINFIFEQCKSIIDFNRFILKYPSSTLYEKAYNKIEDLLYQSVLVSGEYTEYYKRYPNGRYISELKSLEEDVKFKECKTVEDYVSFVKLYPNSKNIVKANLIIEQAKTKKRNIFFLMSFVFAIIITVVYISSDGIDKNKLPNNTISQHSDSHLGSQPGSYSEQQSSRPKSNLSNSYSGQQPSSYSIQQSSGYSDQEVSKKYRNNSLKTGSKPYSSQFGSPLTGDNYFDFKTSSGYDYVVIIKTSYDNGYINHVYIRGGEKARLYVPDGNFNVYFYSGKGWNPNKKVNQFMGGFTTGGSVQKDGPVELYSAYMEYTLYPVTNGNLRLKGADVDDVFN